MTCSSILLNWTDGWTLNRIGQDVLNKVVRFGKGLQLFRSLRRKITEEQHKSPAHPRDYESAIQFLSRLINRREQSKLNWTIKNWIILRSPLSRVPDERKRCPSGLERRQQNRAGQKQLAVTFPNSHLMEVAADTCIGRTEIIDNEFAEVNEMEYSLPDHCKILLRLD